MNGQVALVDQALTELHNLVNDSDDYDADAAGRLQFLSQPFSPSYIVNICLNNYCKPARHRTHSNKTKSKVQSKVSTYQT
jgi:hypothetical protein